MVSYKCDNCDKIFKQKVDYTRHINRKIPCKNGIERSKITDKQPKITEYIYNNKQCQYCHKIFTRPYNLTIHLKNSCRAKKIQDNQKEELLRNLIEEMKRQNQEMAYIKKEVKRKDDHVTNLKLELNKLRLENVKHIQNNNNITIQNNINKQQNIQINNNIKLLAFGKENIGYLIDDIYKQILNKGFKSVPTLVEHVHFNRDIPENHNVYISNIQTNYALVYDGNNWKLMERDGILQQLVDDKTEILSEKFYKLVTDLDESTVRKFQRFLDHNDEDNVIFAIKNDLKLLLYNNKNIPERTREILSPNNENKKVIDIK